MKDVTQEYGARISRLQQVLIENTSTLSDKLRSEIYSRFNNVRYFLLDCYDIGYSKNTTAYYSTNDGNIYIMDKNYHVAEKNLSKQEEERLLATMPDPITDVVILHEMIHSVTRKIDPFSLRNNACVGYRTKNDSYSFSDNAKITFYNNKAINEGATEFYAQKFLNRESSNYIFYVQIYRILSDVCGYEKLKEAYFSSDIRKFKSVVKEAFHLKDDVLTEKLLQEMDVVYNAGDITHAITKFMPLVRNCFRTLTQMQINKIKEEAKVSSKTDAEVSEKFKAEFENFNIKEFIMKDSCFISRIWLDCIANQLQKDKYSLLADRPKINHSENLLKNTTADIISRIKTEDKQQLLYYKKHLGDDRLDVLRMLNQPIEIYFRDKYCSNQNAVKNYLRLLSDKNNKINLTDFNQEDKYEFMSLVLYCPYLLSDRPYENFYLKDIQEYLNSQDDTYTMFLDDFDAMEYIEPIVPNLNNTIKSDKDFMKQYKYVKENKVQETDELK